MNTKDVEMIFAEANLLKNLNHKNIVKILDCFTFTDLKAYFIMEYLPGGDLMGYINKYPNSTFSESET